MHIQRSAGVLLHPTSLPGPYGIGDLGAEASRFLDYLASASVRLWQVLPLSPTGYGNSPYSARSAFAGSPLLISPDLLVEEGLLKPEELEGRPGFPEDRIDFASVIGWKLPLLRTAAQRFIAGAGSTADSGFGRFCRENAGWLDDYALYAAACAEYHDSRWFSAWPTKLADRGGAELERFRERHAAVIACIQAEQYFFHIQWSRLHTYAANLGISIIGDVPIFVAADSADAWINRDLFKTDASGSFSAQSGVPPDFFSETGQLWGMPVYDWEHREEELLAWWMGRVKAALTQTDIIRIDHFRGLESYWEVPAGAENAIVGTWRKASGDKLFARIQADLGDVPIIAEDLGIITPEVERLRDSYGLPGMKILQFAFEPGDDAGINAANGFLPHNYPANCVAYTGTHDNNTTLGWYEELSETERDLVRRYLARSDEDIVWSMIRQIMWSAARYAVLPLQDLFGLDGKSRMNTPSTVGSSNWSWRAGSHQLDDKRPAARLREMVQLYGRT